MPARPRGGSRSASDTRIGMSSRVLSTEGTIANPCSSISFRQSCWLVDVALTQSPDERKLFCYFSRSMSMTNFRLFQPDYGDHAAITCDPGDYSICPISQRNE